MPYGNAKALVERAQAFWNKADDEDRPLTPDERYQVEQLHERAKQAKALEEQLGEFEGGGNWIRGHGAMGKGPGDRPLSRLKSLSPRRGNRLSSPLDQP